MRSALFLCLILLSISIPLTAQAICESQIAKGSAARANPDVLAPIYKTTSQTDVEVIGTLSNGKAVEVTDSPICADGFTWLPITVTTREGFVQGWVIENDGNESYITPVDGTLIAGSGITALLPEGLADSAEIVLHEKVPETAETGWTLPEYVEITLKGYMGQPESALSPAPVITIYRIDAVPEHEDYNMWEGGFVSTLAEMQPILAEHTDLTTFDPLYNRLPLFAVGAATNLLAQRDYLAFQNGEGYHSLTSWGQMIFMPTNDSLKYDYVGLTSDGQYFVKADLPVDAAVLPGEEVPAVDLDTGEMKAYLERNGAFFDGLESEDFTPNLATLDALIASLYIGD